MSKFALNFIVDARYLGEVMAALQPYKIEDLGFKLVAGTSPTPRVGEKPAWVIAAGCADDTPRPIKHFRDKLKTMGFKDGTIYNALERAVQNKALARRMVEGKAHYLKGAKT